jgi:hypothetical protein
MSGAKHKMKLPAYLYLPQRLSLAVVEGGDVTGDITVSSFRFGEAGVASLSLTRRFAPVGALTVI